MNFNMCMIKLLAVMCMLNGFHETYAKTEESLPQWQDPLFRCLISGGSENRIKKLVNRKNVNLPDKDGITPLHFAMANYPVEIADLFIKTGALVNARDNRNRTSLHYAAANGKIELVKLLLKHGADVDARDNHQATPLHYAATNGHVRIAQLLIKHHAIVNARTIQHVTPLHYAALLEKPKLAMLLLNDGAMIDAQTKTKDTPLHFAVSSGNVDTARLLLDRGAPINKKNKRDIAPLHKVLIFGTVLKSAQVIKIIKLLLQREATIDQHAFELALKQKEMLIEKLKELSNEQEIQETKKNIETFNKIIRLLKMASL